MLFVHIFYQSNPGEAKSTSDESSGPFFQFVILFCLSHLFFGLSKKQMVNDSDNVVRC